MLMQWRCCGAQIPEAADDKSVIERDRRSPFAGSDATPPNHLFDDHVTDPSSQTLSLDTTVDLSDLDPQL